MSDIPVPTPIELDALTEGTLNGTGAFDVLMQSMVAHLDAEFAKNRINGAERAQVYVGSVTAVMNQATQFLLQKDQSTYQALLLSKQAELIELEKDKLALEIIHVAKQNEKIDKEILMMDSQIDLVDQQVITEKGNTENITTGVIGKQQTKLVSENANTLKQGGQIDAQTKLVKQQLVTETAATADTTKGTIGKQQLKLIADVDVSNKQGVQLDAQTILTRQQLTTETAATSDVTEGTIGKQQLKLVSDNKAVLAQVDLIKQQLITERAETTNVTAGTVGKTQSRITAETVNTTKAGNKIDAEKALIDQNKSNAVKQGTVLTNQGNKINSEKSLLDQKNVTEQAQTRSGIAHADSVVGKQKTLYQRQAEGFLRDAEQKGSKIALDAFAIIASNPDLPTTDIPNALLDTRTTKVFEKLFTEMGA